MNPKYTEWFEKNFSFWDIEKALTIKTCRIIIIKKWKKDFN